MDLANSDAVDNKEVRVPVMASDALTRVVLRAKSTAFSAVRRGPGEVVWPMPHMGLGNLLYLCLWAHQDPTRRRVLETPTLAHWFDSFPSLASLSTRRPDVRLTDKRLSVYAHSFGRFGEDFTRSQLDDFVNTHLASAIDRDGDPDELVVNVRRGDYFDVPENRVGFAMDQDAYLQTALRRAFDDARPQRIRVVSDGMDWCRARLGWMHEYTNDVTWSEQSTPVADFAAIATAGHLVITNSTFSYWGGYVRDVLAPEGSTHVIAPRFFHRTIKGGRDWPMPPEWSIVEDIPGGWDS